MAASAVMAMANGYRDGSSARRLDRKRDALILPRAGQTKLGCQPEKPQKKSGGKQPEARALRPMDRLN